MVLKAYIQPIALRKWFPSDDPIAQCIARLCVLREYAYLELKGMTQKSIRSLDLNTVSWRMLFAQPKKSELFSPACETTKLSESASACLVRMFSKTFKTESHVWVGRFPSSNASATLSVDTYRGK